MVLCRNRKTCISVQQMFRSIRRLRRKMIISSQTKFFLFEFSNSFPSLIFGHCDLTFETPLVQWQLWKKYLWQNHKNPASNAEKYLQFLYKALKIALCMVESIYRTLYSKHDE